MLYVAMAVQWLHILAGIAWFGGSVFVLFVLVPAVRRLSAGAAGEFLPALASTSAAFFPVAGVSTVVLGIVRGLLSGISLDTAYGITYVAAVVLGVGLLVFGAVVTGGNVKRLATATAGPEQQAALTRARRSGTVELVGFLLLLALMVAMGFGY